MNLKFNKTPDLNDRKLKVYTKFLSLPSPVIVERLVINESPKIDFSWIRFLSVFVLVSSLLWWPRLKLWRSEVDLSERSHKLAFIVVVSLVCIYSIYFTQAHFGVGTNPITYTYYANAGSFPMSNAKQSCLNTMPRSQKDVANADRYAALMDGFSKGHLYLDLPVDPRLHTLDDVLDYSERMAKDIYGFYDLALYKDHWYIYYGVAPLLLYYPVYWLTGQTPTAALSAGILAVLELMSLALVFHAAFRSFKFKTTLPRYLLGLTTVLLGSMILRYQLGLFWSDLLYLLAQISCCLYLYCLLQQCSDLSLRRRSLIAFLGGLMVVLMAMSRPQELLIMIIMTLPLLLLWRSFKISLKNSLITLASICVPVMIGAAFVMWYNYARFENVFEFGFNYTVGMYKLATSELHLTWDNFGNYLYHVFLEPFDVNKIFPFIHGSADEVNDFGYFRHLLPGRGGLIYYPVLILGVTLICVWAKDWHSLKKNIAAKLHFLMSGSILFAVCLTLFMVFDLVVMSINYNVEYMPILCLITVLAILRFWPQNNTVVDKVFSLLCVYCMVKTALMGILIPLGTGKLKDVNPDAYLQIAKVFTPFS